MKIHYPFIGAALLAASTALSAQEPIDLLNSEGVNCQESELTDGSIYTFTYKNRDGVQALIIHGDIHAQLTNNKGENMPLEQGNDGENGAPYQLLEITEDGQYTLTIEKGGKGAVCLSAPS